MYTRPDCGTEQEKARAWRAEFAQDVGVASGQPVEQRVRVEAVTVIRHGERRKPGSQTMSARKGCAKMVDRALA